MKIKLDENERIDDLEYKGLKIIQNSQLFCFGIDSILLSDFAKEIKKDSTVVDLGTGNGILGILLSKKTNSSKIIGVEIQQESYKLATRNVKLNKLEDKVKIINSDIKKLKIEDNSIDVVITNPPYKKINTGKENDKESLKIARHEVMADLNDFISISKRILKTKGELYIVHRPERTADLIYLLRQNNLEPKKIRMVYPTINHKANLVLIKAIKNSNPFLTIEKPLIVYNEDRTYTKEVLKIYSKGE